MRVIFELFKVAEYPQFQFFILKYSCPHNATVIFDFSNSKGLAIICTGKASVTQALSLIFIVVFEVRFVQFTCIVVSVNLATFK
jgi:hypothetical protein